MQTMTVFPRVGLVGTVFGIVVWIGVATGFGCKPGPGAIEGDASGTVDATEPARDTVADGEVHSAPDGDVDAGPRDPEDEDGRDGGPGIGERDCECADPDATCVHQEYCGLADEKCTEDRDCPDGYFCRESLRFESVCVCDGTNEECGPYCDNHEDCARLEICEKRERFEPEGFCRTLKDGIFCQTDYSCGRGEICDEDRQICVETGSKALGETCSRDIECNSGVCHDGACDEQCLSDADCPRGEHCISRHQGSAGESCRDVDCNVSCADNWRCEEDECKRPSCRTTSDCPEVDCIHGLTSSLGYCLVGEPSLCKPNEVRTEPDDSYCRLVEMCDCLDTPRDQETDCDVCPESYECHDPELSHVPTRKVCSRRVVEKSG
jgi:hypothetical protein